MVKGGRLRAEAALPQYKKPRNFKMTPDSSDGHPHRFGMISKNHPYSKIQDTNVSTGFQIVHKKNLHFQFNPKKNQNSSESQETRYFPKNPDSIKSTNVQKKNHFLQNPKKRTHYSTTCGDITFDKTENKNVQKKTNFMLNSPQKNQCPSTSKKQHQNKTNHPVVTAIASNIPKSSNIHLQTQTHSTIVDSLSTHSTIVARFPYKPIISREEITKHIKTYGKFQSYPDGILNPSFCGMTLWELRADHIFNDFKLCPFHQIKSGIILYGHKAYIFTPIENNDIKSHLKILLQNKKLKNNISHARAGKLLVDYVCNESTKTIIPCITTIQRDLQEIRY